MGTVLDCNMDIANLWDIWGFEVAKAKELQRWLLDKGQHITSICVGGLVRARCNMIKMRNYYEGSSVHIACYRTKRFEVPA